MPLKKFFPWLRRPLSQEAPIETPQELGERFGRELCELVDHGEITKHFAERISNDLFEPANSRQSRRLRWSVWCEYIKSLEAKAD